jgi:hypothetical protein
VREVNVERIKFLEMRIARLTDSIDKFIEGTVDEWLPSANDQDEFDEIDQERFDLRCELKKLREAQSVSKKDLVIKLEAE